MKPHRLLAVVSLVAAAAFWAVPVIGQADQEESNDNIKLIKLNFAGGSAVDYVAALRKSAGGLNVFVAPEAAQVAMPAIELNGVTPSAALQLLHDRRTIVNGATIQLMYDEIGIETFEAERVFTIQARISGRSQDFATRSQVWSVAGTLAMGVKTDDMLTAIETALDLLDKSAPQAQIRFHEATGILIVRGGSEQLEAINQVVDMLRMAIHERKAVDNPPDAGNKELREALHQRELMLQQMQIRIQALEAELAAARKK